MPHLSLITSKTSTVDVWKRLKKSPWVTIGYLRLKGEAKNLEEWEEEDVGEEGEEDEEWEEEEW